MYLASGGIIVNPLSNIENSAAANLFQIIPNPTNGIFEIASNKSINQFEFRLFDVLGKLIKENKYSTFSSCEIDLTMENAGFYLLELNYEGKSYYYKVVKK